MKVLQAVQATLVFTSSLFTTHDHPSQHDSSLVAPKVREYIEHLSSKWGIPGMSIAIVAAPGFAGDNSDWITSLDSFGIADSAENAVTRDVSVKEIHVRVMLKCTEFVSHSV